MSFGRMEYLWNSVDVRGDDGLLHHGRVVDTAAGGLIIDFAGAGVATSTLVPFGQIYRCKDTNYLFHVGARINWGQQTPTTERPVEVLLRAKPEYPWKWYPGTLLNADFSSGGFGFVSVTLGDRVLKGIVAGKRIREGLSEIQLASLQVTEGQFLTMTVVVRSDCAIASTTPDDHVVELFNANCQMGGYSVMATYVHSTALDGLLREMGVLGIFVEQDWMLQSLSKNAFSELGCKTLALLLNGDFLEDLRLTSPPGTAAVSAPDGDIHFLLLHLMLEIFQCLTPLERADLRGVCKTWQRMLTSLTVQRVLALTATDDSYEWAACLYNCWNEQTKVLVLHGSSIPRICDDGRMVHIARFLARVMAERELPAFETIMLVNMKWSVQFYRDDWANALYADLMSLATVCHKAIWRNITADLGPGLRIIKCGPLVNKASVNINHQFTTASTIAGFWAILSTGLPDTEAEDMDRLTAWFRHVSAAPNMGADLSMDLLVITKILQCTQTCDPQEGVHYRERTFHADGIADLESIDVRQLTKLTQQALLQYLNKRDIPFVFKSIPFQDLPHPEDDLAFHAAHLRLTFS